VVILLYNAVSYIINHYRLKFAGGVMRVVVSYIINHYRLRFARGVIRFIVVVCITVSHLLHV
jgi:hypothetical protein